MGKKGDMLGALMNMIGEWGVEVPPETAKVAEAIGNLQEKSEEAKEQKALDRGKEVMEQDQGTGEVDEQWESTVGEVES